jgi:hypothetical protein
MLLSVMPLARLLEQPLSAPTSLARLPIAPDQIAHIVAGGGIRIPPAICSSTQAFIGSGREMVIVAIRISSSHNKNSQSFVSKRRQDNNRVLDGLASHVLSRPRRRASGRK